MSRITVGFTDTYQEGNFHCTAELDLKTGQLYFQWFEAPECLVNLVFSHIRVETNDGEFSKYPYVCDVVEIEHGIFVPQDDLQYIRERLT